MRLIKIMYLHKTFNLAEDWDVTYQGIMEGEAGGCNWKTSQNDPENQFYSLI